MKSEKIFSSALSQDPDVVKAIDQIADKVLHDLKGKSCDFVLVFIAEGYQDLNPKTSLQTLKKKLNATFLMGCNATGVICDQQEIEMRPAVSVLAMHLPNVKFCPFTLSQHEIGSMTSAENLIEALDIYPTDNPKFICLADPLGCDVTKLLDLFNTTYSKSPVIGGLASGSALGGQNWLYLVDEICINGAVGVALVGDIHFEMTVSQGCRSIGEPYTITRAEQNVLYELAGEPALKVLQKVVSALPEKDQILAKHSLFVGLLMDEKSHHPSRGDFLIRNIMGAQRDSGALGIGSLLRIGQTLQFQLRDAETSREDLTHLLEKMKNIPRDKKEGALLVSCCGRGQDLYGEPHHDSRLIQTMRGPLPVTGFFANGEFGPIHQKNFIHGFTSSLAVFS